MILLRIYDDLFLTDRSFRDPIFISNSNLHSRQFTHLAIIKDINNSTSWEFPAVISTPGILLRFSWHYMPSIPSIDVSLISCTCVRLLKSSAPCRQGHCRVLRRRDVAFYHCLSRKITNCCSYYFIIKRQHIQHKIIEYSIQW